MPQKLMTAKEKVILSFSVGAIFFFIMFCVLFLRNTHGIMTTAYLTNKFDFAFWLHFVI